MADEGHAPSATLNNVIEKAVGTPFLKGNHTGQVIIAAALSAREKLGVDRYGATLDDHPERNPAFWLDMAREELSDAAMYLQRALSLLPGKENDLLSPKVAISGSVNTLLRDQLMLLLRLLDITEGPLLEQFEGLTMPQAMEMFPPCKVEKK